MGRIILRNAIKREPGKMYYIDGEGNLCVADMKHKGRPRKENEKKE